MTLKQQYNLTRIAMLLAFSAVSFTAFSRNYLLSGIFLVITGLFGLLLMKLRRKVDINIADERDEHNSNRASYLAINTYSWIMLTAVLIISAFRDRNPIYMPIAMTMANSALLLLLIYGLIFQFKTKLKLTDPLVLYLAFVLIYFSYHIISSFLHL